MSIVLIAILACFCLQNQAYSYSIQYPFRDADGNDFHVHRSENFGAYRKYFNKSYPDNPKKWYAEFHTGVDLGTSARRSVYPLANGTVVAIQNIRGPDYGLTVIVDHGTWQSSYSHLASYNVKIGNPVYANRSIGVQGSTGKSTAVHLHLNVGSGSDIYRMRDVKNAKGEKIGERVSFMNSRLENPLSHGLNLSSDYSGSDSTRDAKLYLLSLGTGKEITKSDVLWGLNKKIRIIVEAYDKTMKRRFKSNPYRITFKVYDFETEDKIFDKEIRFDDLRFGNSSAVSLDKIYNLDTSTRETSSYFEKYRDSNGILRRKTEKFYFYKDWTPPKFGFFKVVVGVYDLVNGSEVVSSTAEKIINIGTVGVDFYDTTVYPASVGDPPLVDYFDLSNASFSSDTNNLLGVCRTYFTAKSQTVVNWSVEIYDGWDNLIKSIDGGSGRMLDVAWDGTNSSGWKAASGTYTYRVIAELNGESKLLKSGSVTVDKDAPALYGSISPSISSVTSSSETVSFSLNPAEDLDSTVVEVLDEYGQSVRFLASTAGIMQGEDFQINWDAPASLANGNYVIHAMLVDKAGNANDYYSYIRVDVPDNPIDSPPPPDDYEGLLLPPFNERPIVSDIAFDSSGNKYVLYGRDDKLVKYNSAGTMVASVAGLRLPMGLAVSPSGDRVYVADTYNNRMLIYDGNLNPLKEVKGQDIYITYGDVDSYCWGVFGLTKHDESDDAGRGEKNYWGEGYGLPEGLAILNNDLYIIDKEKHRLLKFDKNGVAAIFSVLKADLKDEARSAYNQNNTVSGRTVERALFYSNSLNDEITFDPNSIDKSAYDRGWMRSMFLHSNPAGNTDSQFASPSDVAIDSSGNLYVSDTSNNRIQKFAPDGSFVYKFGEDILKSPKGIDVDSSGNIWVADGGEGPGASFQGPGASRGGRYG
ncbi:MAG: peptidoglycan DD-metalloendopeptidase family protein [bacterium]